jgi:hypothetical protein
MSEWTAHNGTTFTDADLEAWAGEAEAGWPHATFGPSRPGRPVSVGDDARPVTVRLDAERRSKLHREATERHTSVSQVVRALIDQL